VYASNTGSGEISSYSLAADGSIALLDSTASETADVSQPTDMAVSRDGINLYAHLPGRKAIVVFEINPDGSLNRRKSVLNLPHGAQGLAAH
jgi:hypothetical protein